MVGCQDLYPRSDLGALADGDLHHIKDHAVKVQEYTSTKVAELVLRLKQTLQATSPALKCTTRTPPSMRRTWPSEVRLPRAYMRARSALSVRAAEARFCWLPEY